jgi:hypothetical protein
MNNTDNVCITLSHEQKITINEWIGNINIGHLNEECEPPGFDIVITVAGLYGTWAKVKCGNNELEIGEVEITPSPSWSL